MRTRFAPSPTGYLHVGGLRTALYAWLLAKQSHGQFLLRIEDTDQERFVPGAVESILKCLAWAGLSPDEGVVLHEGGVAQRGGHGPYIQSERKDTYRSYALELIQKGHAYYAFDTKEELDRMREEEQARGNPAPKYDWSVRMRMKNSLSLPADDVQRRLASGEPYVIRFLVPSRRTVEFTDDIRGKVRFESNTLDDQVLLKSDGHATYHLAHVVDDHHMQIDVVIRGEEWLPSLPKHLLLFEAFGWPVPRYAHVALLLNKDRTKLSKRTGSVSVEEYITKGYLPEALLNFIAMLGWNAGTTQELFSVQELIEQFSLDRVQKAGAIFDTEKLDWLQGQWIRRMEPAVFAERILPLVREHFAAAGGDPHFVERAALIRDRIGFFHEAPDMLSFFYAEPAIRTELLASEKQKVSPDMLPDVLDALITLCEAVPAESWNHERLLADAKEMIGQRGWKLGQLLWPMRAALTGREFSPGAVEVADALGRDVTLARLRAARAAV